MLAMSLAVAQQIVIEYMMLGVFVLGTIGSLMNIVLFSQSQLRSNTCCTYFLASSFATLILLSMGIIPLIYAEFNSLNPFFCINAFCKIRVYINQSSAMSCRWLLVMACVDRSVACSGNINIRHFLTTNMTRRITVLIIIIWMILPIHTLIFVNIIPPGNIACRVTNNNMAIYHGIYTIVMGGTLPPIVMLTCTRFIWKCLKRKNERRQMINMARSEQRKNIRDQQVLIILLAQVAVFIVSTIPFMSNNLYTTLTRKIPDKSIDRQAIENFSQVITELFVYIFPASSFYLNTLVSRTFRRELITMFKRFSTCCRKKQNHINPNAQAQTNGRINEIPMIISRRGYISTRNRLNKPINE
ncbi:unnamed protein product [Rotaria sp. Silwood2]|nr:unnamed protein product [Rotaria sp. Silwood2]